MASKLGRHDTSLSDAEAAVAALSAEGLERDADEEGWLAKLTKALYRQASFGSFHFTPVVFFNKVQ